MIANLLNQFVCVRVVDVNTLDLSLFQFDLDLTFAVFLLNSDRTIYGRFGTRSDLIESERDISLEALRAAMEAALELHRDYPSNKARLRAKTGLPPRVATPSAYPWIIENVKPNCIHCHQVGLSKRLEYRTMDQPLPAKLLYAWPMPDVVGLKLDHIHLMSFARGEDDIRGLSNISSRLKGLAKELGCPVLALA